MQRPCVEWLLSNFCKKLDESALPIFENEEKVFFAEDSSSSEEYQLTAKWNCLNKQLLSATTNIRDNEQVIQFLEKWLLRSSDPASYISDAALGKSVTPGNDVPIKDVLAGLQKRGDCPRNTYLELSRAMNVLLRHKLKEIESPTRATIYTTRLNPFDPPRTLIRIWNDELHTLYTESLGFRCGIGRSVSRRTTLLN